MCLDLKDVERELIRTDCNMSAAAKALTGIVTPASGLPFSQQPSSQANEENQLQRVSFPA
jgi:hypothetical protein